MLETQAKAKINVEEIYEIQYNGESMRSNSSQPLAVPNGRCHSISDDMYTESLPITSTASNARPGRLLRLILVCKIIKKILFLF